VLGSPTVQQVDRSFRVGRPAEALAILESATAGIDHGDVAVLFKAFALAGTGAVDDAR
jgi:hypothetical protein